MGTVRQPPPLTDSQQQLLHRVFRHVLDTGRPIPVTELATAVDRDPVTVAAELAELDAAGHVHLSPAGEPTGAFGLTTEPTRHEMLIGGARRHTWCALDALGIMGALDATGEIRTVNPRTERPMRLEFRDGEPCGGDLDCVLLLANYTRGTRSVETWCPLVNLFDDTTQAQAWAAQHGVDGECHPLAEAAALAAAYWRQRLPAHRQRTV